MLNSLPGAGFCWHCLPSEEFTHHSYLTAELMVSASKKGRRPHWGRRPETATYRAGASSFHERPLQ